jgi:transposase
MSYLGVQDRFQIQMRSMEEFIEKENAVRFVDAFVEQLELEKLGFEIATLKTEGRPAFNPKVFLKLYLSGYLNFIQSKKNGKFNQGYFFCAEVTLPTPINLFFQ